MNNTRDLTPAAGRYYWRVVLREPVPDAPSRTLYAWADSIGVDEQHSLCLLNREGKPLLVLAQGVWAYIGAVSILDNALVCLDHWQENNDE